MIITKFEDFLNENAQDGILKLRTDVLNILKASSDKITKSNVCIVKDGKKAKLTAAIVDGTHKPRYDKGSTANSLHPEQPAANVSTTANGPFSFVFNCEGGTAPIADYKITVTDKNNVSMTNNIDTKEAPATFNRHNMKFIPDHIQQQIEKKFGKVQTA